MIVGSFLVKNCLLHYHERWFWDCLFDADYASNSASWQWIAGCGADAAPFVSLPSNPRPKFDPDGVYVKQYCPGSRICQSTRPWARPEVLQKAGVDLGVDYHYRLLTLK